MDPIFSRALDKELIWFPEKGWGHFPVQKFVYDDDYFDNYTVYAHSHIADPLNKARVALVNKYTTGKVLDVGPGVGTFIDYRGQSTYGFDVNPKGIKWLKDRDLFLDPYTEEDISLPAMTFWDSLEHIHNPGDILIKISDLAFVSMPVYLDLDHLLASKHFKKAEHVYYFTEGGLVDYMSEQGFRLLEHNTVEVECGREDIGTFVFKRR